MKFRRYLTLSIAICGLVASSQVVQAQHLQWRPASPEKPTTCIYGEIEVLSTNKYIYYCGCNWWPGNPAGGYTGIQDQGGGVHNMIFSIWDTSPTLHPSVTETEKRTEWSRFGGEGTGAHTHLNYAWEIGKTYKYFVKKDQDSTGANTLTKLYFFDDKLHRWVHQATISNPNDGHVSVKTFGGGLNAFLENWMGEERQKPKLALYRLWTGNSPSELENVTACTGDGNWGILNNTFYLAEGETDALAPIFSKYQGKGSGPVHGGAKGVRLTVTSRKVPPSTVRALNKLDKS